MDVLFFFPVGSNKGLGSLQRNYDLSDSEELKIETIVIDDYRDQFDKAISLIKIDVQGAEFNALQGMQKTIQEHKPVIIFEIEDEYFTQPSRQKTEIHAWFSKLGYVLYAIEDRYLFPFDPGSYFHGELIALPNLSQHY